VVPLRLDVQIFSGIAPPAEVLARMTAAGPTVASQVPIASSSVTTTSDLRPHRKPVPAPPVGAAVGTPAAVAAVAPPVNPALAEKLEIEARRNSDFGMNQVPIDIEEERPHQQHFNDAAPDYGEAPPSYEDAIATDLPPVRAPRPQYAPPPMVEDSEFLLLPVPLQPICLEIWR
jgi:hypothetical protein